MSRLALFLLCGCSVGLAASVALADPPGRVGRISDVEGDVSFLPPDQSDWTWADRNYPVTAGESFWTSDDGRVELQAGGMEIRTDSDTEVDVLDLDYGDTRLALTQGSVDLRLWRAPRGGVTVSTPVGDIEIDKPGIYRIDVGAAQEDGSYPPVELTVFEGDAGAPSPEGFADVQAGDAALIYAGYDPEYVDAQDAAVDDWARSREQRERWDTQAAFAPSMTGYEDLAGDGEFISDPDYGTVWFPSSVPADWAPYRFGHWAYVNPWGYTWIDDEPWGFAPFHYGRWVQVEGRWGWVPGQATAEPVYAPALVAFFGVGASIGWAPLAPDEAYRPTYEVSETYWRRVNAASVRPEVIQNININTTINVAQYRNAGAAVVVGPDTLSRGGRVQGAAARIAPVDLARAAPVAPRTLAPPSAQALAGGGPKVNAAGAARPAPPPSRLEAVRASVKAQPAGSSRPPAIAGATIAPPKPPPSGAPAFVAPAQRKNPEMQARRPVPPPAAGPGSNSNASQSPTARPMRPYAAPGSVSSRPEGAAPSSPAYQRHPEGSPYQQPPSPNSSSGGMQRYERAPAAPQEGAPPSRPANRPQESPYRQPPSSNPPPNAAQRYERSPANPQEGAPPSRPANRPEAAPFRPNAAPTTNQPPSNKEPTKKEAKPKPDEKQPPPQQGRYLLRKLSIPVLALAKLRFSTIAPHASS
jgi:hypothetical protein